MRIKSIEIKNFKRFTDLTININDVDAKLVVMLGPNGSGKSSILDAFEQIGGRLKPGYEEDKSYLRKELEKEWDVNIISDLGTFSRASRPAKNLFYLRSSYRFDPDFRIDAIHQKDEIISDSIRPKKMISLDKRVQDNYERLVGTTVDSLYSGSKDSLSVPQLREELIGKVKTRMLRVFPDLVLESIGNPLIDGQFFFTKGVTRHFPYKNLSSGEKGAFDILLDLIVKTQEFNNSTIAIDEPELHMHSALQKALLKEFYELVPDTCQLWVATHSIGFIRGALDLLKSYPNKVVILNFSNIDFDQKQIIIPTSPTVQNIKDMFSVAVDDLSNMLVPARIAICEGSLKAPDNSLKKEFDTNVYNIIFQNEDILFISGDNKTTAQKSAELLFKILSQSGSIRGICSIVDRDDLTKEQVDEYIRKSPSQRILSRKTIENYLLDSEIIDLYCDQLGKEKEKVTSRLRDPDNDDAKGIQSAIMQQCEFPGNVDEFKITLAKYITPGTKIYAILKKDIGL